MSGVRVSDSEGLDREVTMSHVTPRALIKLNVTGVQCVRHILLSSPPPPRVAVACFILFFVCTLVIAQAIGRPGKGSYWTVNDFVDPCTGLQRVRKRKAKQRIVIPALAAMILTWMRTSRTPH